MLFLCPGCQRTFDEPGYCPFDRTQLVSMSEARTVVTGPMRAVPGPHTTAIDRRGTLPLTPAPAAGAGAAPAPAPAPGGDYDKLIGQTLDGRYHIEKKIGEGGMGVVFAARHAVIERPLAIKVLRREVMRDAATIRRFVQEAKAASRIGHPNIVDVTDFGTTPDGMTYFVMEHVTGQTLGAALRRDAPFAVPRAVRIAAQLARALGAAHDKGIVHRDLKPENVFLLDRDGRPDFVKIVDFGIAKVTPAPGQDPSEPRLTRAGSVFGTPEYMAPEQAAGKIDTDGRVDIYALGVILYQMLTGRVPHKGDSMVRTLAMQMLEPPVPPSRARPDLEIPPALEELILKALAKRREHRFQTMGELLAALDALQTPVGISVTGSPVYALVPLPPGADPALAAPAMPPGAVPVTPVPVPVPVTPVPSADASAPIYVPQPITAITGDRARTPTGPTGPGGPAPRPLKDEPAFVTGDRPIVLEPPLPEERPPRARRNGPVLLLFALIFAGATAAIAFVAWSRSRTVADRAEAPAAPPAPAPLALSPDAAGSAAAGAFTAPPADASAVTTPDLADAGEELTASPRHPRPATPTAVSPRHRRIEIQVHTKPEGARLFVGSEDRGPAGALLAEPSGTKLDVTCKLPGYKDGTVRLVFDGTQKAAVCALERIVVCIPGVKNPFDNCPE